MTRAELLARTRIDEHGHWLWEGSKNGEGYGYVSHNGRWTEVHRIGWMLWNGPIPAGLVPDHRCRVKACWNPSHLRLLTHAQNTRVGYNASNGQMSKKALRQMRWLHSRVGES